MTLLRVQDAEGRGPWRPGSNGWWLDEDRTDFLPGIFEAPGAEQAIAAARAQFPGSHLGCAVPPETFSRWFTERELSRLRGAGYRVVNAGFCGRVIETPVQVLVMSRMPLTKLPRVGRETFQRWVA